MDLSCPVSAERINENVVRIIAFVVALIGITCVLFTNYWAILFLAFDFAMRAFKSGKWSLLKFIAIKINDSLSLPKRLTDLAPKKFAASLGFVFCVFIGFCSLFQLGAVALVATLVLTTFALLESVFAICVGCYVYSLWRMVRKVKD